MTNLVNSRSRLVCFVLVLALLLAYTPGTADTAYAETDPEPIEIVLGTDADAVNAAITGAGIESGKMWYQPGDDTYTLHLKNLGNDNIQIINNLPQDKKLMIGVQGENEIGSLKSPGASGDSPEIEFYKEGGTPNELEVTGEIYIKYAGERVVEGHDPADSLYFNGVGVSTTELKIESPGNVVVQVWQVTLSALTLDADVTGKLMLNTSASSTPKGQYQFSNINFSGSELHVQSEVSAENLSATNAGNDKGVVIINGGNLTVDESLIAQNLKLRSGEADIKCGLGTVRNVAYGQMVHTNASDMHDVIWHSSYAVGRSGIKTLKSLEKAVDASIKDTFDAKTPGRVTFGRGYKLTMPLQVEGKLSDIEMSNYATRYRNNQIGGGLQCTYAGKFNPIRVEGELADGLMLEGLTIDGAPRDFEVISYGYNEEKEKISFNGVFDAGNLTTDAAIELVTTTSALAKIKYTFVVPGAGRIIDYEVIKKGETPGYLEEMAAEFAMSNMEMGWFTDEACTVPFDPTQPVNQDLVVYGKSISTAKPIKGEINIPALKICKHATFSNAKKLYGGIDKVIQAYGGKVSAYWDTEKSLYAVADGTIAGGDLNIDSMQMVSGSALDSHTVLFAEGKTFFVPYRVIAVGGYELDPSFKVKSGTFELPSVETGDDKFYLCPVEAGSCTMMKVAENDPSKDYWRCNVCETIYSDNVGAEAADLSPEYKKSLNDDLQTIEDGKYSLAPECDTVYLKDGQEIQGDVTFDLGGHKVYIDGEISATGTVTIKNGELGVNDISAKNLVLDKAKIHAESPLDEGSVSDSIELKNGSVWEFGGDPLQLADGCTLTISDTSKIMVYATDEITMYLRMMIQGESYYMLMNAEQAEKLRPYLPRGAKTGTLGEFLAKNLPPEQLAVVGSMYAIAAPDFPLVLKVQSGGGSHSGGPSENVTPAPQPPADTPATGKTVSENVDVAATVQDGKATAEVRGEAAVKTLEKLLAEAGNSQKEFVVNVTGDGSTNAIETRFGRDVTQALTRSEAIAIVKTGCGNVNIPAGTMNNIAQQAGTDDVTLSMEKKDFSDAAALAGGAENVMQRAGLTKEALQTADILDVNLAAGAKNITGFGGGKMELLIPLTGNQVQGHIYRGAAISADGSVEGLIAQCVTVDGKKYGKTETSHLTTFIVTNDEVKNPFTDVKANDYFFQPVLWAVDKEVTGGVSATSFAPNAGCTRAQMVTFLWRAAGKPWASANRHFSDVADSAYYKDAVEWAIAAGITKGVSENKFNPNGAVTREQLASFIYRYAQEQGMGFTDGYAFKLDFSDAGKVSAWADEAMHWCVMQEIVGGTGNGKLTPQGTATRGQIVTMLYRYFNL